MRDGTVEAIFVGPESEGPMRSVASARLVAGAGVEGDRYWQGEGGNPQKRGADREVTLIEAEALEALRREAGFDLAAAETRRNVVTRGVALNPLVGREFRVGGVTLRGLRKCDPCGHLEKLTRPGVLNGLADRGGLRARIVNDGEVRVGDPVQV